MQVHRYFYRGEIRLLVRDLDCHLIYFTRRKCIILHFMKKKYLFTN